MPTSATSGGASPHPFLGRGSRGPITAPAVRTAIPDLPGHQARKTSDSDSDYDLGFRQTQRHGLGQLYCSDLRETDFRRLPQTKLPCIACRRPICARTGRTRVAGHARRPRTRGLIVRTDTHLTYMIDIALTTEFSLAAGCVR